VQTGVAKRFGKRSVNGTNDSRTGEESSLFGQTPDEGGRDSGVGDGTVAIEAVTCGSRRGPVGMSSVAT